LHGAAGQEHFCCGAITLSAQLVDEFFGLNQLPAGARQFLLDGSEVGLDHLAVGVDGAMKIVGDLKFAVGIRSEVFIALLCSRTFGIDLHTSGFEFAFQLVYA